MSKNRRVGEAHRHSPLLHEGMARRKAQNLWCPRLLLGDAAGASRRASTRSYLSTLPRFALLERIAQLGASNCAQGGQRPTARKNSACSFGGDLANTGPRFRLGRPPLSQRPERYCAQVGQRPVAQTSKSSASSWQGLVVVPGGAPVPPECPACEPDPRGAAPRPTFKTPLERAPQRTRWAESNRGFGSRG